MIVSAAPDVRAYRRIVVAFSGGKDSLTALLHLLSLGLPSDAIELHHHDVDGHGPSFMDWPCTPGYVRAIASHRDELAQAEDTAWRLPIIAQPWSLPAGAFGDGAGPS